MPSTHRATIPFRSPSEREQLPSVKPEKLPPTSSSPTTPQLLLFDCHSKLYISSIQVWFYYKFSSKGYSYPADYNVVQGSDQAWNKKAEHETHPDIVTWYSAEDYLLCSCSKISTNTQVSSFKARVCIYKQHWKLHSLRLRCFFIGWIEKKNKSRRMLPSLTIQILHSSVADSSQDSRGAHRWWTEILLSSC